MLAKRNPSQLTDLCQSEAELITDLEGSATPEEHATDEAFILPSPDSHEGRQRQTPAVVPVLDGVLRSLVRAPIKSQHVSTRLRRSWRT